MGEITNLNPACKTGGVKNYVYTSFFEDKKISLTAMRFGGGGRTSHETILYGFDYPDYPI